MRSGQFTLLDHVYETCEQLILPVDNPDDFLNAYFSESRNIWGEKQKIPRNFTRQKSGNL